MKEPVVIHRSKHDAKARRLALADHPAMKELARMLEAGELNRERTLAYLDQGAERHDQGTAEER